MSLPSQRLGYTMVSGTDHIGQDAVYRVQNLNVRGRKHELIWYDQLLTFKRTGTPPSDGMALAMRRLATQLGGTAG